MVFFVLSGFLIATTVVNAAASGRWSFRGYAVRRMTRLWVVLLPALLLTLILDRFAIAWLPGGHLYAHAPIGESVLAFSAAQNDAPAVLVGNMAFLQEIVVPPFGSNSPLWSLAYEFWYYVAFPLLFFAATGPGGWFRRALLAALGLAVLVFAGKTIALYFSIWLLGAAVAFAYRLWGSTLRSPAWLLPLGLLALLAVLAMAHYIRPEFLRDLAVGVAFTLFLVGVRFRPVDRSIAVYGAATAWVAGAAYTVYLVHFPVLLFARAWLQPSGRLQPTLFNAGYGLLVLLLVLGIALALAQLTERRTDTVRAWIERRLPL
jgi:peptidoglycan/LPS O-acetylase OafA/YrhL